MHCKLFVCRVQTKFRLSVVLNETNQVSSTATTMETKWTAPTKIIVQREIGRGSFGVVRKATWRNRLVAVKIFDAQTELIAYEVHFWSMSRVHHPNIITLFAVSFDKQWKYLIMEYAENGTLHDLVHGVREYSKQHALELALQCAEGVAYLHGMKEPIILRYMNPQSLLLTDGFSKLKISNIERLAESRARAEIDPNFCAYLAPEVFEGLTCDEECDVFSWAIIVWELLTRVRPYDEFKGSHELHYHKSIGVRPPLRSDMIDNLKILLAKCWSNFHKDRPSMHLVVLDSVKILSHIVNNQIIRNTKIPINTIDLNDISDYRDKFNGYFGKWGNAKWRDRNVSVRIFEYSSVGKRHFTIIRTLLTRIRHPNIIELLGCNFDKRLLILDNIKYGSLHKLIYDIRVVKVFNYTPDNALDWSLQCAQGVAYIHNMKPEPLFRANLIPSAVMLTNDRLQVKLCDFMTDIYFTDSSNEDVCAYMAPEIINGQRYSRQSDVFSWATLMWELLNRQPPSPYVSPQLNENWPEDFKHVFSLCWSKTAEERPSMTYVIHQMKNIIPTFTKRTNIKQLKKKNEEVNSIIKLHDLSNKCFDEIQIESVIQTNIYKANWNKRKVVVTHRSLSEINSSDRSLLHISHPNIIQIFGVSLSSIGQKCLISEFAENGTLHDMLYGTEKRHYPWQQALSWAEQCAASIAYLHGNEMCSFLHPDLRTCKILLTNQFRQIKIFKFISNFEILKEYQPTGRIAPEVFETLSYTKECDVYSWGILLCEILSRKDPFYHRISISILNWFGKSLPVVNPITKELPKCIKDLIASCSASEPKDRFTIYKAMSEFKKIKNVKFKNQTSYHQEESPQIDLSTTIDNTINIQQTMPELVFKDINIEKTLGRGSFGTVLKGKWCERTVALKEIDTRTDDLKAVFKTELQQLMRVSHRNIIKLFATSTDGHLKYLLIEYAKNGALENVLYGKNKCRYSEGRALNWALQCAEGIAYLHNLKPFPVMHRDLKPHNLLITKRGRRLKICDFGTVVELKTRMTTNQVTPQYMAPEVFEGEGKYSEKCDVFSWAIILWEILKREKPYNELENVHAVQYQKNSKDRRPTIPEEWKEPIKNLIATGWSGEPNERPSMKDAVILLKKIISDCVGMTSYMKRRHDRIPIIPYSDLQIDGLIDCKGCFVFKKMYKGMWKHRSVIIEEGSIETLEIIKEFERLSEASHRNIIKLLATSSNVNIKYVIVEHAKNGTLDNFLHCEKRPYSKTRALSWALQLAEGILHLHSCSIVPRQLMPQYLLLTKSYRQLKISLYGEGVQIWSPKFANSNKVIYFAPEALDSEKYTEKCNVFSWGIILWEILKREKPYKLQTNNYAIQFQKLKGEHPSLPDKWEDSIKNLLTSCWNMDPEKRLTMTDVVIKMKDILNKPNTSYIPKFINQSVIEPEAETDVLRLRTMPYSEISLK